MVVVSYQPLHRFALIAHIESSSFQYRDGLVRVRGIVWRNSCCFKYQRVSRQLCLSFEKCWIYCVLATLHKLRM